MKAGPVQFSSKKILKDNSNEVIVFDDRENILEIQERSNWYKAYDNLRLCHRKTGEVIKIEISFRQLFSWDAVKFLTLFKVSIFQKKWHVLMMKIKKLVKHYILKRQEKGTRDIINNIFFKYWHTTSLFCTLKWDDDDITKLSTYYSLFY